jgi:ribosomal protein S25
MNRTNKQKTNTSDKKERDLLLLEVSKDIASIEEEGFGRVVIEIKNGQIVTWWKVASHTRRGFFKKMKNIDY